MTDFDFTMSEPNPGESRYRVLAKLIRDQIDRGDYEAAPLPTERILSERLGLSRQTVRRAFQDLVSEGLVYRIRGSGTFATPRETRYERSLGSVDDLLRLQLDTSFELTVPIMQVSDTEWATRLGQDFSEVWKLEFRRLHQGQPFCRTRVYLPMRIGSAVKNVPELTGHVPDANVTVIGLIQNRGFDISGADQVITATASADDLVAALGCPLGAPLLHVERTYVDSRGHAVELAVSDFLPDRFQHRTKLGRVAETVTELDRNWNGN